MTKHLCVLSLSLFGILAVPLVLNADPVKKRTEMTFNQPVEIPGMVLEAGTYAIKIPDPVTHADMVGFYNLDETQLYKLVRTIPAYRLDVTDTTAITFEERTKGAPLAIKTWFYPGDNWGKEFVYGKAKTIAVGETVPAPLPEAPVPAPEPAVAEVAPAPQPEAEPVAEAPEARVEIAELPLAASLEAIPSVPIEELPKTASSMPLIALLGVSSLALGALLGWVVRGLAHR
jgi:LPXTG-motif cell wall-anchored protein